MTTPEDRIRQVLEGTPTPTPTVEETAEDRIRRLLGEGPASTTQPGTDLPPDPGTPGRLDRLRQGLTPGPEARRSFLDLTQLAEPGTFLGPGGPVQRFLGPAGPGQAIETGLDVVDTASIPFEAAAENLFRSFTGIPQDIRSIIGQGEARQPQAPFEALESFRDRPWWQQLAIGAIDPTLGAGRVPQAARGIQRAGQAIDPSTLRQATPEQAIPTNIPEQPAAQVSQEVPETFQRVPFRDREAAASPMGDVPQVMDLSPGSTQVPQETVGKLTTLIREAKPVRAQTAVLQSQERSRRVGRAAPILEGGTGREAFRAARATEGGSLPRAAFEPTEAGLSTDEVTGLFNFVRDSNLRYYTKQNTADALNKVLLGEVPTRSEIVLLENMFGPELAQAVLGKRRFGDKAWELTMDAINVPRTVKTSYDASAPLRQGIVLAPSHPGTFAKNVGTMMKAWAKEGASQEVDQAIRNHPNFQTFQDAGLFHAERGSLPRTGRMGLGQEVTAKGLTEREEAFMSRLASRIPGIRQSERAYVTFLNKMRFDVMNNIYEGWQRAGKEITGEELQALSGFLNHATGRGDLPRGIQRYSPILNATFFSPRLQLSRFQLAGDLVNPSMPTEVRKIVARDLAAFVGTGILILSLLKLSGAADVETDPRSSDFGKIRIGPTRMEFWGSFQPIARYTAQLITGKQKNLATKNVMPVRRQDIVGRFIRSKLSPPAGAIANTMIGRDFLGQDFPAAGQVPFTDTEIPPAANVAVDAFIPLFIDDLSESIEHQGWAWGSALAAPGFFGAGVQSFDTNN